jgi:hypothetical protein
VLFLPEDPSQWLVHTEDGLVSKRCAYWVCLRGAAPCDNKTGQTVYIPRPNWLSHDSLRKLATKNESRSSRGADLCRTVTSPKTWFSR